MTRYFFHIRNGEELVKDDEGTDLPDVSAARREAALSAQALILEAAPSSEPLDHVAIEIWDDTGAVIEVVQVGAFASKH
jgi:hypothetical protein